MMNRAAGIGSLMRAGPAPGRAGLSHLARGEAVIPNAAMNADPSLRQRAMMAMASRGRNPSQFTVGQRNLRNPATGAPMFADLIYTDQGWVDPATGAAPNFAGNSFADTGTTNWNSLYNSVAAGNDGASRAVQSMIRENIASDPSSLTEMNTRTGLDWSAAVAPRQNGMEALAPPPVPTAPQQNVQDQASDFSSFSAPQTYDQWRMTRNPTGKGMENTLFGQTQTAGGNAGFSTGGMEMPNVLAGQMPVAGASWGTPGTALGFGRENTANDPSILRSGYNDLSLSPSIYAGAFGGTGMLGNASGIAFSGQSPLMPGQSGQQKQYGAAPYGFNSAFQY